MDKWLGRGKLCCRTFEMVTLGTEGAICQRGKRLMASPTPGRTNSKVWLCRYYTHKRGWDVNERMLYGKRTGKR